MSDETDTTSEVARVLGEHVVTYKTSLNRSVLTLQGLVRCACGWDTEHRGAFISTLMKAHADHVAHALAEAGLLREDVGLDDRVPVFEGPKRRLRACVENWADAETGEYDPSCCRFPKSCSATVYSEEHVTEDDLEPQIATQEPAGGTQGGSGDSRVSGGLGERLRALMLCAVEPEALAVPVPVGELRRIAAEVDRLEVFAGTVRGIRFDDPVVLHFDKQALREAVRALDATP